MLDQTRLDACLMALPGAQKDYKVEWEWERYLVGGKMFAANCCPAANHAAMYAGRPLLTLKCDPVEAEFLRAQYPDILPGFYMDKRHWISICLDGDVPQDLAEKLCAEAHRLVFEKLTQKCRREILQTAGIE